jgi:hypothetical protein
VCSSDLGRFVPITISTGVNVYMGTHPRNAWGVYFGEVVEGGYENPKPYLRMAIANIVRYPGLYLLHCFRKTETWLGTRDSPQDWEAALPALRGEPFWDSHREKVTRSLWVLLVVVGTVAGWLRRNRRALLVAALYWVYFLGMVATYLVPRFILPSIPLACLLGGAIVVWAVGRREHRSA